MITVFLFVIFSTYLRFIVTFLFLAICSFLCLAENSAELRTLILQFCLVTFDALFHYASNCLNKHK